MIAAHSVTNRPCEPCGPHVGAPCCMRPIGSVSVLICSGGPVHSLGRSPPPLRAAATARPGQPSLHHLAVCPHRVLEGGKTKRGTRTSTYEAHTHTHGRVTVALVYPALRTLPHSFHPLPLSPDSVMLRVASHKCQCHRGTVINFGVLGKMSSRGLFGMSLSHPLRPAPLPARLLVAVRECQTPPPSSFPLTPLAPTVTATSHGGGGEGVGGLIIINGGQRLPELKEISFSDQSRSATSSAVCSARAGGA